MKIVAVAEVGEVTIRKSKLAKRLILKINSSGKATVTIPYYVPYKIAERYLQSHAQWLRKNMPAQQAKQIYDHMPVGKKHHVTFKETSHQKPASRVQNNLISITVPQGLSVHDQAIQSLAQKACERALRKEAETLLPSMLHTHAALYGYKYREVRIKSVRTRWGSCSSNRIINLSIWLMQLPEELIEYVICHELTHLNHMHHGTTFWEELATMIPDYKQRKKNLKLFAPTLLIP